ncbi:DUF2029 domain-containing protein [Patescibacteria group bacterium]|nr:DUF2029 domain-containing protein [Patescibacteria group bacterium]
MKKFFLKWILIGLALRLILMPFTVHPDIRAIDLGAYLISQKGEWLTFYDHLSRLDPGNLLVRIYGPDLFIYPPLAYLIPGVFMFFFGPLYDFSFNNLFLLDMGATYRMVTLFKTLFLLKLPYLLFDFLLAFLLYQIFAKKKGETAFKLWMVNPLTLYATFAMGQIDIFPTLMIVAALFFALRNKKSLSVLMLGIGGAFKLFPLLFLPIFVLVLNKRFWQRLKLLVIGIVPYLAIIAPYLLFSPMFRQSALLAGQTEKMLYMKLPLSGAEYLSVFAMGYFLLLFLATRLTEEKQALWQLGLVLMLLFFSVTHYHPQWFLWITPFLVWLIVENGKKYFYHIAILLSCYFVILLFFESSLHLGLFVPLAPSLARAIPLTSLLSGLTNIFTFKSFLRSLFTATALVLVMQVFKEKKA